MLGLEYSKEAARVLKSHIKTSGVRIDYEADAVTLHISRKQNVIPVLREIYRLMGWDAFELDAVEPQVLTFKRPKPRRVSVGDAFLVPVGSDLFGLGQVLDLNYKSPTIALFADLGRASEMKERRPAELKVLTILHMGGNSLYNGAWEIVGNYPVLHDPASGPGGRVFEVGCCTHGGDGPVVDLLRAYAGLRSWEEGYHDPNELRKLVLPGQAAK
jgi:hypothetical protein